MIVYIFYILLATVPYHHCPTLETEEISIKIPWNFTRGHINSPWPQCRWPSVSTLPMLFWWPLSVHETWQKQGNDPKDLPVLTKLWRLNKGLTKETYVNREISLAIKVMLHSFCARFTWPRRVIGKWRAKLIHSWIQRHQGAFTHKTKKCKYHRSIAKCKYITPCLSKSWASSHFWRTGFNLSCNFLLASRIASIAWRSCPSENVPHRSLEKTFLVSLLSSRAVMIQVDNLRLHLLYGRVIKFPESHV